MASEEPWRRTRRSQILAQLDKQNEMLTEILQKMSASNQKVLEITQRLHHGGKPAGDPHREVESLQTIVREGFAGQAESTARTITQLNEILELKGIK